MNIFCSSDEELNIAIKIVEDFNIFTGTEINIKKTFAATLNVKKENLQIMYGGARIEIIAEDKSFRFLGLQRNLIMDWTDEQNRLKSQLIALTSDEFFPTKLFVRFVPFASRSLRRPSSPLLSILYAFLDPW